jgi:hypothetical protein
VLNYTLSKKVMSVVKPSCLIPCDIWHESNYKDHGKSKRGCKVGPAATSLDRALNYTLSKKVVSVVKPSCFIQCDLWRESHYKEKYIEVAARDKCLDCCYFYLHPVAKGTT